MLALCASCGMLHAVQVSGKITRQCIEILLVIFILTFMVCCVINFKKFILLTSGLNKTVCAYTCLVMETVDEEGYFNRYVQHLVINIL